MSMYTAKFNLHDHDDGIILLHVGQVICLKGLCDNMGLHMHNLCD